MSMRQIKKGGQESQNIERAVAKQVIQNYKKTKGLNLPHVERGVTKYLGGKKNKTRKRYGKGASCSRGVKDIVDKATLPKGRNATQLITAESPYEVPDDWASKAVAQRHPKAYAELVKPPQVATIVRSKGGKKTRRRRNKKRKMTKKNKRIKR